MAAVCLRLRQLWTPLFLALAFYCSSWYAGAENLRQSIGSIKSGREQVALNFEPIAKPGGIVGEPFEYETLIAQAIWDFMVFKKPSLENAWGHLVLRNAGEYATLTPDNYLVLLDAYYLVQPKLGKLIQLTRAWPPGNAELPAVQHISNSRILAITHGEISKSEAIEKDYYAFFIEIASSRNPKIRSSELLSIVESPKSSCPVSVQGASISVDRMDKYVIEDVNGDKRKDIVFFIDELDCRSSGRSMTTKTFVNHSNWWFTEDRTKGVIH